MLSRPALSLRQETYEAAVEPPIERHDEIAIFDPERIPEEHGGCEASVGLPPIRRPRGDDSLAGRDVVEVEEDLPLTWLRATEARNESGRRLLAARVAEDGDPRPARRDESHLVAPRLTGLAVETAVVLHESAARASMRPHFWLLLIRSSLLWQRLLSDASFPATVESNG